MWRDRTCTVHWCMYVLPKWPQLNFPTFCQRSKAPLPVYYNQLTDDTAVSEEVDGILVSCAVGERGWDAGEGCDRLMLGLWPAASTALSEALRSHPPPHTHRLHSSRTLNATECQQAKWIWFEETRNTGGKKSNQTASVSWDHFTSTLRLPTNLPRGSSFLSLGE